MQKGETYEVSAHGVGVGGGMGVGDAGVEVHGLVAAELSVVERHYGDRKGVVRESELVAE